MRVSFINVLFILYLTQCRWNLGLRRRAKRLRSSGRAVVLRPCSSDPCDLNRMPLLYSYLHLYKSDLIAGGQLCAQVWTQPTCTHSGYIRDPVTRTTFCGGTGHMSKNSYIGANANTSLATANSWQLQKQREDGDWWHTLVIFKLYNTSDTLGKKEIFVCMTTSAEWNGIPGYIICR